MDDPTLYRQAKERIKELIADVDVDTPVPACPGWSVRDIVAHQAGALIDLSEGVFPTRTSDEWTAKQVEARSEASIDECIAEWDAVVDKVQDLFETPMGAIMVADVVSHEHDIRGAIGKPGERDTEPVHVTARRMLKWVDGRVKEAGAPPLHVKAGDVERVIGEGDPRGKLETSAFELMRVLSGRRTPDQVRKLDWQGEPDTWLPHLFVFGPAERDVIE